jgi:hypothetical protein
MTIWVNNIARKFFLLATMLLIGYGYAHAQNVPIPDPNWPLDSVINGAVHRYTVPGDPNYNSPSTFVWTVNGGRLFFDENLTTMAGDGTSATVTGNGSNITTLWVVWDSFEQPLDTGYVYVFEISADGCQRSDDDPGKYIGMRIKVSAPPKVRFLRESTIACSNYEGMYVDIAIEGMPPFDLKYSINGQVFDRYIEPSDLIDSDFDGEVDNVTIYIDGYVGATVDQIYELVLLEASSGGVFGEILQYPVHTIYAYRQPDAPVISPDWPEVTVGQSHNYPFIDAGLNPDIWYWELQDNNGNIYHEFESSSQSHVNITFNIEPGEYNLVAYYLSLNGCVSLADTHRIEVFEAPTISFSANSGNQIGCSEVSVTPDEFFEFTIEYEGARSYDFTYAIFDYNGLLIDEYYLQYQTDRAVTIIIPNTFINDELPEVNRAWKVKIMSATNEEAVNINILDSEIEGGRDERLIIIHPKPVIHEDIDFAN